MTLNLPNPGQDYSPGEHAQSRRIIAQAVNSITSAPGFSVLSHPPRVVYVQDYGAKGDGIADDTAAIQAAITSGLPVNFLPGVYVVSATLNVTAPQNDGQVIRGSGSYGSPDIFNGATGKGATVIKPTSAVTSVFLIDGTGFAGGGLAQSWVQGFGMENLAIDMANMTDVSTNAAIVQIQAWDCHYSQVRIRNDGVNKRGWLYKAGAFTTQMQNTQCHIIEMAGNSPSFGVTTINILNHDGGRLICTNTVNVRVIGGAFQGAAETKFYFRLNSAAIYLACDVEGTGIFLDVDTTTNCLHTDCQLQGFSGTYMNGTPGPSAILMDQQTNFATYPFNFSWGAIQVNNQGTANFNSRSSFLSGSNTQQYYLYLGRAGGESFWGVAAAANDFVSGSVAGDTVFGSNVAGEATYIVAAGVKSAKATSTGFNTYGTGTLLGATFTASTATTTPLLTVTGLANISTEVVQPATDGQMVTWENHATTPFMIASSNATVANSTVGIGNGAKFLGFSDGFVTQTINLDSASGNVTFAGYITSGVNKVVGARQTGWVAPTGTLSRATFDQSTVTLPELAKRLAALITDLSTHGLIGI